jgi:hypothetical protein
MDAVYKFNKWYKFISVYMIEDFYYATKRGSPRRGREGDNANVIF